MFVASPALGQHYAALGGPSSVLGAPVTGVGATLGRDHPADEAPNDLVSRPAARAARSTSSDRSYRNAGRTRRKTTSSLLALVAVTSAQGETVDWSAPPPELGAIVTSALDSTVQIGSTPNAVLVLLDVVHDQREGRSSAAAKKVDAERRIAFARRSSRTSRSSSPSRAASAAVVPGRASASTSAWVTQPRSVSGLIPSCSPIRRHAPGREAGPSWRPTSSGIDRSRSSSGYFSVPPSMFLQV